MSMVNDASFAAQFVYRAYGDPLEINLESPTMEARVNVPTHPVVDVKQF